MSRQVEKKNTLVLNSAGANTKDLSQGHISYMLPREGPNQDEATVTLEIKDIRFGQRNVTEPEVTTIINGNKEVSKVPFTEPLKYHFKKVEDDMVFKFAVTSAGDLLGFIYLEIPHKFKTMKNFKLDDWFPIKHLETEEYENIKKENFVARIVVNYKGQRKLETTQPFTGKLPKAQLYEEMAKNLKQRINDINTAVDAYNDEGFKHLANFEKKLLKKKIRANGPESDPKKTVQNLAGQPKNYLNIQKDHFYKTRTVMGETAEIRQADINPAQLYQMEGKTGRVGGTTSGKGCPNCEKLLKELSYSRSELIEANQRMTAMEEGLMTVDNVQLKRQLEREIEELAKDRKEFNLKLRDQNDQLRKDRQRLQDEYQKQNERAIKSQEEYESLSQEYQALVKSVKIEQAELSREKEVSERKAEDLAAREARLAGELTALQREKAALDEKEEEMKEIKLRMMQERQRILEEGGKYAFVKGDVDLKQKQLKGLEDFLNEEKEEFKQEMDRKNLEIDALKAELKKKQDIYELEVHHLNEDKKDLERRNKELTEEKKKLKIESVRLWRDKNRTAQEMDTYLHEKKALDTDKAHQLEELDQDYAYIDEQLKLIEDQKREFDGLKGKLESYEKSLADQQRIQEEQQERFQILQRNFFEKLSHSEFDIDELRKQAQAFGYDFAQADQKFRDNQRVAQRLEKQKESYKRNIENIIEQQSKEGTVNEKRTTNLERRQTRNLKEGSDIAPIESAVRLKRDANDLIEDIFANVLIQAAKRSSVDRGALVDELSAKVSVLERELADEQSKFKQYKLSVQAGGGARGSDLKGKSVPNPFHGMDDKKQLQSAQAGSKDKLEAAEDHNPMELQTEVLDLCDAAIDTLDHRVKENKNVERSKERIAYLQNSKKVVKNIFKILNQTHEGKIDTKNTNLKAFDLDSEEFDYEIIRRKYNEKIKSLIDYIQKIRDNTDFFNNNIDNEILIQ